MDGRGDPKANVQSVGDRDGPQPSLLFRTQDKHCDRHGKGNGRVRSWPAPKDSAAQQAESEDMGQVWANRVRRMMTSAWLIAQAVSQN
jgi:hypothetical protein